MAGAAGRRHPADARPGQGAGGAERRHRRGRSNGRVVLSLGSDANGDEVRAVEESKPSLVDIAEEALRTWLATGRHRPGERLPPEQELSAQLGISRGTLRTALQRLEDTGEIVRRQGSGTYVGRAASTSLDEGLEKLVSNSELAANEASNFYVNLLNSSVLLGTVETGTDGTERKIEPKGAGDEQPDIRCAERDLILILCTGHTGQRFSAQASAPITIAKRRAWVALTCAALSGSGFFLRCASSDSTAASTPNTDA